MASKARSKFGDCCKDLHEAMTAPSQSFFAVDDNGILYLTIGYVKTDEGTGWFDQAVIFCPFCGLRLQDAADIKRRANGSS